MRPNTKQLAMRDPALAALMGVDLGADFGAEFGDPDDDYGAEFGDPDHDEVGDDDYGAEFGLARRPPSAQQLAAMWRAKQLRMANANRRVRLLDPNRGSGLKVERYIMALDTTLTIPLPSAVTLQGQPDCTFRPQRLTIVVPTPGFVIINQIRMANVSIMIGPGSVDAFQFNANGVGQTLDMPTLTPANRATVTGAYTGFAGGFPAGGYLLSATFIGPANLAGGSAI
jgi:hypothetical protein